MIEGKEGIAKKKDFLILFGALVIIGFIIFVFAAIAAPTLQTPMTKYNYSGKLNFTCYSSMMNTTNATLIIVNATGAITANNISTVQRVNTTGNDSTLNATVDISMLKDGLYNFTCLMRNISVTGEQNYIYSANTTNVTIDNTAPNATFANIANGAYLKGDVVLNASVNDATIGMGSVRFNITANNETATQENFTNASVSANGAYFSTIINTSTLADGKYNITIYANDTDLMKANSSNGTLLEYANMNSSERISVTIDNTAPTATYACTPNTTVGQIVTCVCSASDATAGVNYTYDGDTTTTAASITKQITATAAGTFSRTCTVKDRAGNIGATITASYTITNPTSSTSGGGGGGGTTTPTTTITAGTITPTSPATVTSFASSSGISEMTIEVSETATNVKITIQNYETTAPSAVSSSSATAYKYLKVDAQNLANKLSKATMKIQVEKSWVSGQGIAKEDVALFKYDTAATQWNELTTKYASEDDNYYYYTVELSSFSYFVIAAKGAVISEEEVPTGEEGQPTAAATGLLGLPVWVWIVIVLAVLVAIGGGIALGKKKKKK